MTNFSRNFLKTNFQFHLRLDRKKPSKLWHQKIPIRTVPAQLKQLKYWRVQSTNDTPIGKLSQRTIRNIFISLWVIQENPVFFSAEFSKKQASFDWNFSRIESRVFSGEAFDLLWDFGGFCGFDCSWTGLEWKIDESFRGLGIFFQWVDWN